MAQPFLMTILSIESTSPRISTCTAKGLIQKGSIAKGDIVQIVSLQNTRMENLVTDIELIEPTSDDRRNTQAKLTLQNPVDPKTFAYGWIISPPNAISCHSSFLGEVTFLTPEEGGRRTSIPLVVGHAPAMVYEVILTIYNLTFLCLPQHPEPESLDYMEIEPRSTASLVFPIGRYIALDIGYTFQLQEGGKVVATGVVTELY